MTGLDATIARALDGFPAGTELSFDSLRDAATAAQLGPRQVHGQLQHAIHAGYIEPLRAWHNGVEYDLCRPTEHAPGTHRLIRHYVRTTVPVPGVAVAT